MAAKTPIQDYLMVSESKTVQVLLWLLANRDRDNLIYTTLDAAAVDCGVTKVTVNKTFQKLYKAGFMEKQRNGVYQLRKI